MGVVWRGVHRRHRIPVAVKMITADRARSARYLDAFRSEVQAVARLDHPAIVRVLDHGEVCPHEAEASEGLLSAGSPYLVMELCRLGPLENVARPLPFGQLRRVLLDLLDALAHAEQKGALPRLGAARLVGGTVRVDAPGERERFTTCLHYRA